MIHEWVLIVVGVFGFGLAGYLDLRYTEFPDWLPYSMIILAILVWGCASLMLSDFSLVMNSLAAGITFLGIGLALYFTKQWGDGDAWLLGAMGFIFPVQLGIGARVGGLEIFPFPVMLLFNFFIIGFAYLVLYSLALGAINRRETSRFLKGFSRSRAKLYPITILAAFYAALAIYASISYLPPFITYMPLLLIFLYMFMEYGKFVEKSLFKKKRNVRKLRPGDVLVRSRWRGLTEKEIGDLRKKGGDVWVKEGVRFAPVFVITLLVILIYGNLISLFV